MKVGEENQEAEIASRIPSTNENAEAGINFCSSFAQIVSKERKQSVHQCHILFCCALSTNRPC
jgi:hypothetical protein